MEKLIRPTLALAVLALVVAGCSSAHTLDRAKPVVAGRTASALTVESARRLSCELRDRRFVTLPALRPTGLCLALRRGTTPPARDILVTPRPDPKSNPGEQFGLMVVSPYGQILWYERRPTKVHDLKVVDYHGQPMLAYFQQDGDHGYYQLLDEHYRPVLRIRAGHGFSTNLHELQLTPQGDAWISADVKRHVRKLGTVTEYVVQKVDAKSGRVLFQWRSLRPVSVRDSYERRPGGKAPWDYFHGNAVDPPTAKDATVMISSRNTSSLYGVDPATGKTEWILGGKRDQFGLARHPSWVFCAQHDAHRLPNGDIELFDNGGTYMHGKPHCPVHPARAMVFRIDPRRKRVHLVRTISSVGVSPRGHGFFSGWVGSARPDDQGTLVDWGQIPRVSLFGSDGREDLLLRLRYWSYRATPATWTGDPPGKPTIVARRHGGDVDLWASWNGATRIATWLVLTGTTPGALTPIGRPVPFADLETAMTARTGAPYVAVRALDEHRATLGQSRAVRTG